MQFIKTLFWVVLAVILVVFAANNWSPVSVLIWHDLRADTKLPVLVIGAFLLGFVPTYLIYRASLWRLRRRIRTLEQAHAAATAIPPSAPVPTTEKDMETEPLDLSGAEAEQSEPDAVEPHAGGPRL